MAAITEYDSHSYVAVQCTLTASYYHRICYKHIHIFGQLGINFAYNGAPAGFFLRTTGSASIGRMACHQCRYSVFGGPTSGRLTVGASAVFEAHTASSAAIA
jgi:hypothetical protein